MAQLDIILNGSALRTDFGMLGICTLSLIRDGKTILFDTGHFGNRRVLLDGLKQLKLSPKKIDIVVLSHLHWDHVLNIPLFRESQIIVNSKEFDYARDLPADDWATPSFITTILEGMNVEYVEGDVKLTNDVQLIETSGHTIGHMSMIVETANDLVIIGQDALPTARSYLRGMPDYILWDEKFARRSIEKIKNVEADVFYPGHDRPFRIVNGKPEYILHTTSKIIVRRETEEDFTITLTTEKAEQPETV